MIEAFVSGFFGTIGVLTAIGVSIAVLVAKDLWDLWRKSEADSWNGPGDSTGS